MINDTNITIVSKSFSRDVLVEECHEHFMEELLGKQICHEHVTENKRQAPTTVQRMYFFAKTNHCCLIMMIIQFL